MDIENVGSVQNSGFQAWGRLPFLWGRQSFSQKYSYLLLYFTFFMELIFVVAKIIGSPGKNDSLLFHSNYFKCDYDHHSTEYCCVWQHTNNFVT